MVLRTVFDIQRHNSFVLTNLVLTVLTGEGDNNVLALALGHFADFLRIDGVASTFEDFLVED